MIREDVEIAILGSGFAGTLTALILHRMGRRVALLERGTHPRFSLGESSTPLANLMLEEIARDYDLPFLHDLAEYGRWKKTYPDLTCGLKRGFTFVKHDRDRPFVPDPEHRNELLVTASPADEVADTHWLRADFDHFLVRKAVEAGVCYVDRARLALHVDSSKPGKRPWQMTGSRDEEPVEIEATFLVDATGPTGVLARWAGIDTSPEGVMRTSSWCVYNHFADVERWEDLLRDDGVNTSEHPYRCDAAALHHVLDDGWIYVLRFDNGVTSAGILFDGSIRPPDSSTPPEELWRQTMERYPGVARQFRRARPLLPWVRTGRLQRRTRRAIGGLGYAMLASSAYSLDALYSTGIAHTVMTVQRLVRVIGTYWTTSMAKGLMNYEATLFREIDFLDTLVHGSYQAFRRFDVLAEFTMYYFAGAIAAEERRQRGQASPDEEVLSSHFPEFRAAVLRAHAKLCEPGINAAAFQRQVAEDIGPWNTVGLCDPRKRNLYPYG